MATRLTWRPLSGPTTDAAQGARAARREVKRPSARHCFYAHGGAPIVSLPFRVDVLVARAFAFRLSKSLPLLSFAFRLSNLAFLGHPIHAEAIRATHIRPLLLPGSPRVQAVARAVQMPSCLSAHPTCRSPQGSVRRHFTALGFTTFIHRKRDFYRVSTRQASVLRVCSPLRRALAARAARVQPIKARASPHGPLPLRPLRRTSRPASCQGMQEAAPVHV